MSLLKKACEALILCNNKFPKTIPDALYVKEKKQWYEIGRLMTLILMLVLITTMLWKRCQPMCTDWWYLWLQPILIFHQTANKDKQPSNELENSGETLEVKLKWSLLQNILNLLEKWTAILLMRTSKSVLDTNKSLINK